MYIRPFDNHRIEISFFLGILITVGFPSLWFLIFLINVSGLESFAISLLPDSATQNPEYLERFFALNQWFGVMCIFRPLFFSTADRLGNYINPSL